MMLSTCETGVFRSRYERNSFCLGQFRSGNELIALFLQFIHDSEGSCNGTVRHIVKQDHIPIPDMVQNLFFYGSCVVRGLVLGIY